jgi:hypothetical protein
MLGIFSTMIAAVAAVGLLRAGGILSLAPQQYGQVNVLYAPVPSSEQGYAPPDPCVVDVTVLDGQGNQVKFQESSLQPGQSATLTFHYSDLNGGSRSAYLSQAGNQGIFTEQASVKDTCGNNATCDATLCSILQSVEIVDDEIGVTRVLVSGLVQAGPAPAQAN